MSSYAKAILDKMGDEERQAFIDEHGGEAFAQLWKDAHRGIYRGAPPMPPNLYLGEKVLRRDDYDRLSAHERYEVVSKGAKIVN